LDKDGLKRPLCAGKTVHANNFIFISSQCQADPSIY
jgi:hypothetical protein